MRHCGRHSREIVMCTGYYGELEVAATFHKSIYALLPPEKIRKFLEENSDEK